MSYSKVFHAHILNHSASTDLKCKKRDEGNKSPNGREMQSCIHKKTPIFPSSFEFERNSPSIFGIASHSLISFEIANNNAKNGASRDQQSMTHFFPEEEKKWLWKQMAFHFFRVSIWILNHHGQQQFFVFLLFCHEITKNLTTARQWKWKLRNLF